MTDHNREIKSVINENYGKGQIRVNCFNCEGSQQDTLSINTETGVYHCFRCGIKGNALKNGFSDFSEKSSAQDKAIAMLNNSYPVNGFPYLRNKQIKAYNGIREYQFQNGERCLLIPVMNHHDEVVSLQIIKENGDKLFLKDTEKKGNFFRINGNKMIFICEGYATGASIHEATGGTVYVAFDAGNIPYVLKKIHDKYDEIVICADNDHKREDNPGINKAISAALEYENVKVVCPVDIEGTDFNDMMIEKGAEAVKERIAQAWIPTEEELPNQPERKATPEIPDNFEEELLKSCEKDKISVYQEQNISIISKIRDTDPVRYQKLRESLKQNRIKITEFEKQLKVIDKALKIKENNDKLDEIANTKNTLILKNGNLPEEVEYCQAVLRDNEIIFERGNALYRIIKVKESKSKDKKVSRDEDSYIIELVNPAWLKLELSKNIKFVKIKMTHQGPISEPANCSFDIVNSICANNGAWDMPYLAGIQNAPVITPEGKIYGRKAGFDHDTELFFTRDFKLPIPEMPTKEEIEQARAVIHEIIREYRFESDIDYSVAFAAILSSVVRRMIPTCPFFAIDSTKAGSGKTKLADCISIIASGNSPATLNVPPFDDKESEKRYDSILLNGDPVILIDNVENAIKSDRLCTIATQTQVTARILGQSKVVTVPSNSLWLLTGNNIQFRGDITRRVLKSRINQGVENPDELYFDKDPVQYTSNHRDEIIQSIIIILKAFLNSDDKPAVKPMGSFEVWSNFIRRAVIWMGLADPCLSKQIIQADDDEKNKISGLLEILYDVFQDKEFIVKDMIRTTDEDLKSILEADFQVKGEISSRKIGNFLSKNNGRIENGLCLEKTGTDRTRATIWRIRITQHVKYTENKDSETHAELAELPKNITQQMQTTDTTDVKYEMQSYAELDIPLKEDLNEKKETENFSFFQNTEKGDRDITQHNSANGINDIENQVVNSAELAKNVTLHNSATQQMDNSDKEFSQNSESESSFSCVHCLAFGTQDGVNRCFKRVIFEHKSGGSVPITDISKICSDFQPNTDPVN
jgi:putative DNA primase/helicase